MEEYIKWLENKIEVCLEDKDLQREHWAFCQALKKYRELALRQPLVSGCFSSQIQNKMSKKKWSFKTHTSALADTGDYEGYVQFTNGKDIFQTSGDELEEEQMQQFCELLDLMPDLWSHKCDNAEFELSQIRKKSEHFEKALKTIRDAFYTDGETDKKKIDDLKAIAFNALYEIEQGLF
jgi:hypothetical protein